MNQTKYTGHGAATTYTLKWGSIAGVQHLRRNDGAEWTAIYVSPVRPAEAYAGANMRTDVFPTLPRSVRAVVNRNFGTMFALPLERREEMVRNWQPQTIEVNE